jgi:hypothetical protein
MAGMARKVIMKASEPVSITFSIQQGFGVVQLVSLAYVCLNRATNVIS